MIFSCLGALILRAFGLNRCQKEGLKKRHKKGVKIGARFQQVKPTLGLWVPLKLRKGTSEDQKTRQVDQTRPDEPEGTVADFQVRESLNFFIFKEGPLNFFIFKKGNHQILNSR